MTSSDQFDAELDHWERELASMEAGTAASSGPEGSEILSKLNKLERQQRGLQEMIDYCRQAEATEVPMSPSSRAILFWACEWADRVDDFRLRYADYLDKLVWLNLLRGRLLGRKNFFCLDISERDVQQLLQRKQSLEQTEQLLQNELKVLQEQEALLRSNYRRYQIELSNWEASQSFTQSARTMSNQRPTHAAFGWFLRILAVHLGHESGQIRHVQQLTEQFTQRSHILMEQCRHLLRESPESEGAYTNPNHSLMQATLLEIIRLENEIETTLSALSLKSPAAHSVLRIKQTPSQAMTAFFDQSFRRENVRISSGSG